VQWLILGCWLAFKGDDSVGKLLLVVLCTSEWLLLTTWGLTCIVEVSSNSMMVIVGRFCYGRLNRLFNRSE
jgi:hypothetical protein